MPLLLPRTLCLFTALTVAALTGCTSSITEKEQYSGFLPDYANLREITTPSGDKTLRWISPSWNPDAYNTVAFRGLELYPAPQPNEQINIQTLQQLQAYLTDSALGVLGSKYAVVRTPEAAPPGSKTLQLRAAITGVSASNVGVRWYEVVPVAAVIGGVSAATGHRDQDTSLFIEAQLIDVASGQTMAKAVRKVRGNTLDNASQAVTPEDFKRAIDKLSNDLGAFIN